MDDILTRVERRIRDGGLTYQRAAREIGVSVGSLRHHLSGGYVRSDSVAKYRVWLTGPSASPARMHGQSVGIPVEAGLRRDEATANLAKLRLADVPADAGSHLVVDLFSGAGGLSLGFELYGRGHAFRSVLALDIDEPVIASYNGNRSWYQRPVAESVDLSDFNNEAEILAFYLDRLASSLEDGGLREELELLPLMGMTAFKRAIAGLDQHFIRAARDLRDASRRAYASVSTQAWRQTSVLGFHHALALPLPSEARLARPIVWATSGNPLPHESGFELDSALHELVVAARSGARDAWDLEVDKLEKKAASRGRGQLASSAGRIAEFLSLLASSAGIDLRDLWIEWRAARNALRAATFGPLAALQQLRSSYSEDRRVSVVLGGPPCQGFSRIGRGKIRSLRENGVHVQSDADAGDHRNLLLEAYVLFVSALAPKVFLFENVRHFQAKVRTPEGTFDATEVLAEAIGNLMKDGVGYRVASQVIDASKVAVPQTRERFFMVGIRSDLAAAAGIEDVAKWVLALPEREPVPLLRVFEGLPAPLSIDTQSGSERLGATVRLVGELTPGDGAAGDYLRWIRQPKPSDSSGGRSLDVDGHVTRPPRSDDSALFQLLGPGRRWMDYRSDGSETLRLLARLLAQVRTAIDALDESASVHPALLRLAEIDRDVLDHLTGSADGSLSIRLLLEAIQPRRGEVKHHLLTPEYLAKREGNHGDWLARLSPDRPSKTIVSHMGKDTYAYVHPFEPRTLSVREAARAQSFPDWFTFRSLGLVEAFRAIGNAVPPLLSVQLAERVAQVLWTDATVSLSTSPERRAYETAVAGVSA